MSVLLRSDDRVEENGVRNSSPLAGYAAEHWVTHAEYEQVSSYLRKAMEYLFDVDKPYFLAWLRLHDIDKAALSGSTFYVYTPISKSGASPLYYAALCGFQDMVEQLLVKDPGQVNARGGVYLTPLVAALAAGHFQTAKLLHDNGADPDVRGYNETTPLHSAAYYGEFEMVQVLLKCKADINARTDNGRTPIHWVSLTTNRTDPIIHLLKSNVARLLLEHGADVNAREQDHSTPLHTATRLGEVEVVRVLLEHGANLGAKDDMGRTALQVASNKGYDEIMKLLSEHGAK
jgi:ankyrin repeat protein